MPSVSCEHELWRTQHHRKSLTPHNRAMHTIRRSLYHLLLLEVKQITSINNLITSLISRAHSLLKPHCLQRKTSSNKDFNMPGLTIYLAWASVRTWWLKQSAILSIILLTLSKSCNTQGLKVTFSSPLLFVHVTRRKLCLMDMFKKHKFLNRFFPPCSEHRFLSTEQIQHWHEKSWSWGSILSPLAWLSKACGFYILSLHAWKCAWGCGECVHRCVGIMNIFLC